jgi:hypothetical protein
MSLLVLICWIVSLVLFALAALQPRPFNVVAGGLFFFDLWVGLTYLMVVTDPITF